MWLSVAFPTCPSCKKNSNQCFHKNCPKSGKKPMEIDPETSRVKCPSCNSEWNIMDTNYYCSCGYIFLAKDVSVEIDAIVANARLIAQELKREAEAHQRIINMTTSAIETRAKDTIIKKFGEKIWQALKSFLPTIVVAIRKWLEK